MKYYRIESALDQLVRYGGLPDKRVLILLEILTDLNDDIWQMRDPKQAISRARDILDLIEEEPSLQTVEANREED